MMNNKFLKRFANKPASHLFKGLSAFLFFNPKRYAKIIEENVK